MSKEGISNGGVDGGREFIDCFKESVTEVRQAGQKTGHQQQKTEVFRELTAVQRSEERYQKALANFNEAIEDAPKVAERLLAGAGVERIKRTVHGEIERLLGGARPDEVEEAKRTADLEIEKLLGKATPAANGINDPALTEAQRLKAAADLLEQHGDKLFKAILGEATEPAQTKLDIAGQKLFEAIDSHGARQNPPAAELDAGQKLFEAIDNHGVRKNPPTKLDVAGQKLLDAIDNHGVRQSPQPDNHTGGAA